MSNDRNDFEVYAGMRALSLRRSLRHPDEYESATTEEAWAAFQAGRAATKAPKPAPRVKTAAEMRHDAAHDSSCVGAFARARPGAKP